MSEFGLLEHMNNPSSGLLRDDFVGSVEIQRFNDHSGHDGQLRRVGVRTDDV